MCCSHARAGSLYHVEKESSLPVICLLHRRPLKVLNDSKLILNDQEGSKKLICNLFGIIKKSPMPQTINWEINYIFQHDTDSRLAALDHPMQIFE